MACHVQTHVFGTIQYGESYVRYDTHGRSTGGCTGSMCVPLLSGGSTRALRIHMVVRPDVARLVTR